MIDFKIKLNVILSYSEEEQEIFDIVYNTQDGQINENEFLDFIFSNTNFPEQLIKVSCSLYVVEDDDEHMSTFQLGRDGAWYFNTDVNTDEDTLQDRQILDNWLEQPHDNLNQDPTKQSKSIDELYDMFLSPNDYDKDKMTII